jgi:hypothetical protein
MISLYRPAGPETELAGNLARCRLPVIGASPSGKAVDFDSTIRRFESSRPSQPIAQLKIVRNLVAKSFKIRDFLRYGGFLRSSKIYSLNEKTLKVSGRFRKYSRFREIFGGGLFRSAPKWWGWQLLKPQFSPAHNEP